MTSFNSLSVDTLVQNNINLMNEITGFGVIIVCCSSEKQVAILKHQILVPMKFIIFIERPNTGNKDWKTEKAPLFRQILWLLQLKKIGLEEQEMVFVHVRL